MMGRGVTYFTKNPPRVYDDGVVEDTEHEERTPADVGDSVRSLFVILDPAEQNIGDGCE